MKKFKYRTVHAYADDANLDARLCEVGKEGYDLDRCATFGNTGVLFVFKRELTHTEEAALSR